jgi:hypothetical protein
MIDEVAASMGKMADTINDSVAPDLIDYDMVGGKVIQWVKDRIKFLESGNAVDGDGVLPSRIQHKALTALAQTLEQMSRENPNNFRIPAMDIAGDSIIAKNGEISIGDVYSKNNGGTSMIETITYERALYDESGSYVAGRVSEGNRYQVMKTNARSALGVAVAHAVRPWAVRGSIDAIPTQLKELKAKQAELAKLVPINPSKEGSTIINTSMPFGVEDIYKPVSLNATIIRAAARGMDSIILSDARHMFNRGYSPNESFRTPYLILGRRRRLFQVPDVMKPLAATIAHMSMFENSFGLYGNLIGRLKEMPDVELEPIMSGYKFTHEGNDLTLYHHFGKLTEQFLGFVYANGTPEYNTPFTLDSVYSQNTESVSPMAFRRDSSDTLGNAMVDENGKPLNPAKVDENSLLGRLFAREKRRVQQAFKSMGSFALLTENGDCMGYVSNYGLPSYWLEGHFAGAERSLIDFYATDAFDVPVLEYQADTGTYNIVDAKTGKLIRATKNKAEALEVFHQSKKYRGGNGYIGNFLKNWSGLGGYVGTAFYSGASSANGLGELHNSNAGFAPIESILRTPVIPKEIAIPRSDVTFDLPNDRARTLVHDQRQSRPDKPLWANNPANNKFRKLQYIARGLMTNKQVTQFETMIASASGTMMRFKPRFPTEEHKTAWRKRAIEGIANLMPSGTPDYRPNPTAGNLDLLRRISELRRAPIENPDDESQTSR